MRALWALGPERLSLGLLAVVVAMVCIALRRWSEGLGGAALLCLGGAWLARGAAANQGAARQDTAAPGDDWPAGLGPVLAELEGLRVEAAGAAARRLRMRVPLGLTAGVLAWVLLQFTEHPPGVVILGLAAGAGAASGWAWATARLSATHERRFKHAVLPLLAAGLGELTYREAQPPDPALLRSLGLFASFNRLTATDEIVGTRHGISVSLLAIELEDASGDDSRTIFTGLLVRIMLPFGVGKTLISVAPRPSDRRRLDRVRLADPVFDSRFQLWSTDPVSAHALLTPALRWAICAWGERPGCGQPFAFAEGATLTAALPFCAGRHLVDLPSLTSSVDSRPALARLLGDLTTALGWADAIAGLDLSPDQGCHPNP